MNCAECGSIEVFIKFHQTTEWRYSILMFDDEENSAFVDLPEVTKSEEYRCVCETCGETWPVTFNVEVAAP